MDPDIIIQNHETQQNQDYLSKYTSTLEYKRKWYRFCALACWNLSGRPIQEDIPYPSRYDRYPTGESLQEAFWRTLVCNIDMQRKRVGEEYGAYWKLVHNLYCRTIPNQPTLEELHAMTKFEEPMGLFAEGRRFCTTSNGYMGWAPQRTQFGDAVCIFQGSPVPFVVRKAIFKDNRLPFLVGPGRQYYELVGECYLHGYMEGQGIEQQEQSWGEIMLR